MLSVTEVACIPNDDIEVYAMASGSTHLGQCPHCCQWVEVSSSGRIRPHWRLELED